MGQGGASSSFWALAAFGLRSGKGWSYPLERGGGGHCLMFPGSDTSPERWPASGGAAPQQRLLDLPVWSLRAERMPLPRAPWSTCICRYHRQPLAHCWFPPLVLSPSLSSTSLPPQEYDQEACVSCRANPRPQRQGSYRIEGQASGDSGAHHLVSQRARSWLC